MCRLNPADSCYYQTFNVARKVDQVAVCISENTSHADRYSVQSVAEKTSPSDRYNLYIIAAPVYAKVMFELVQNGSRTT